MILVDTAVWIDHFHTADGRLVDLLDEDRVATHPRIVEELALGSLARRNETLHLLGNLTALPVLSHHELVPLVDTHRWWGRGISPTDAHLLGSTLLAGTARLWTRDKRLHAIATEVGLAHAG
ncbi:MAG: type II toxin-antitoxin system VapC family toxin [Phycicoccus sp.]